MYPRAQVAAGRIHQVLGAEGMGDPMAGETAELHGEIELQDVSFSYGGSADAISHISLHILPGQRISVIGGTGSGKSTLMHLLLGFRAPTQGRDTGQFHLVHRPAAHRLHECAGLHRHLPVRRLAHRPQ